MPKEPAPGQMDPLPDGLPLVDLTIEQLFTYHRPTEEQVESYAMLRHFAKEFAYAIDRYCPAGPDRTAAMRHLREAVMTANASIATNNAQYR